MALCSAEAIHCSASVGRSSKNESRKLRRSISSPRAMRPRFGRLSTSRPATRTISLMSSRSLRIVARLTEKRSAMSASVM